MVSGDTVVTIVDLERNTVVFLDPQQETYFTLPYLDDDFGGMTAFYRHSRGELCGGGYRATNLGEEAVDGRMAEKWLCESKRRPKYMEGIPERDLRLVFVIDSWHIWYDRESLRRPAGLQEDQVALRRCPRHACPPLTRPTLYPSCAQRPFSSCFQ
jgi:hypothetical protein